jgi:hypothetical protein
MQTLTELFRTVDGLLSKLLHSIIISQNGQKKFLQKDQEHTGKSEVQTELDIHRPQSEKLPQR